MKERGMKTLISVVAAVSAVALLVACDIALARETAKLKDAHIEFKTGGKKKKTDTRLIIQVYCKDGSIAAKNDPVQTYGEFRHFSDSGPVQLTVDGSKAKYDIKGGYHMIKIEPAGNETWTFDYVLTLDFDDGKQLVYVQQDRKATQDKPTVRGQNL
jgi:hypothetical protein